MKKDNFEDILKRKLDGHSVAPPPYLMSSIEKGLATKKGATSIIKPKRRVFLWSSTIAAASVLIAMLLIVSKDNINEAILADISIKEDSVVVTPPTTEVEMIEVVEPVKLLALNDVKSDEISDHHDKTAILEEVQTPTQEKESVLEVTPDIKADTEVKKVSKATPNKNTAKTTYNQQPNNHIYNTYPTTQNTREKKARGFSIDISTNSISSGSSSVSPTTLAHSSFAAPSFSTVNEIIDIPVDNSISVKTYITTPEKLNHKLPVSVSASVGFDLTDKLSIETGLIYSKLVSESETTGHTGSLYKFKQSLHYLGIPIAVRYKLLDGDMLGLYAKAGATIERIISAEKSVEISGSRDTEKFSVKGVQPSTNLSLGGEFKLLSNVALYIEPGVSYYFDNSQPENYRTHNPLSFNLNVGLRVTIK